MATLADVRELTEGDPVEIWLNPSGRIVARAFNECRNNFTDVDIAALLSWAAATEINFDGRGVAAL